MRRGCSTVSASARCRQGTSFSFASRLTPLRYQSTTCPTSPRLNPDTSRPTVSGSRQPPLRRRRRAGSAVSTGRPAPAWQPRTGAPSAGGAGAGRRSSGKSSGRCKTAAAHSYAAASDSTARVAPRTLRGKARNRADGRSSRARRQPRISCRGQAIERPWSGRRCPHSCLENQQVPPRSLDRNGMPTDLHIRCHLQM